MMTEILKVRGTGVSLDLIVSSHSSVRNFNEFLKTFFCHNSCWFCIVTMMRAHTRASPQLSMGQCELMRCDGRVSLKWGQTHGHTNTRIHRETKKLVWSVVSLAARVWSLVSSFPVLGAGTAACAACVGWHPPAHLRPTGALRAPWSPSGILLFCLTTRHLRKSLEVVQSALHASGDPRTFRMTSLDEGPYDLHLGLNALHGSANV